MLKRLTDRGRVVLAALVSLLLHLLGVAAASLLLAMRWETSSPELLPEPEEVELTIVPAPVATPPPVRFIETPADRVSDRPPEKPVFESDADSLAASEAAALGDQPVPSQEGILLPGLQLKDQQLALGREPAASAAASSAAPTPVPRSRQEERRPEPTPPPEALALLDPSMRKPSPEVPTPEPRNTPDRDSLPPQPETAQREPASSSAYRPEQRPTKIEGSVDSRGRTSLDSVATPLGRYRKALSDAIGSRWYYYTTSRMDLISLGTARLRFYVKSDGTVEDIEIVSNTSNSCFGTFTLQAVLEAEIPPIPPDIAQTLENNRLEVEYTFTVYGGR